MNSTHCAHCGSREIEIPDGGAPSRCRICGGQNFVGVWSNFPSMPEARVHTITGRTGLTVMPHIAMPPERVKALFASIHAAIDAAGRDAA